MSYLDGIRSFLTSQTGKLGGTGKADKSQAPANANPAQGAQETKTDFTVDMGELEVKAEMNKALGFCCFFLYLFNNSTFQLALFHVSKTNSF